jgi:molecular chaperone HscB
VQPVRAQATLFEVLDLPQTFFLAPEEVEQRFKDLNRKLHPDRFAQKTPRERRLSLEWTTAVNDAYRTLKDPLRRATYCVKLHGLDVEKESGPSAMGRLPPEFLEEVLEQREALEEAKAKHDLTKVRELAAANTKRADSVLAELARALKDFESSPERSRLEDAGQKLAVLKYFSRFAEEVEAIEMAALE